MARTRLTVSVIGAGARVGKTLVVSAITNAACRLGARVLRIDASLGARPAATHAHRMVERLAMLKDQAEILVIDCAGEREALLIDPRTDRVVLVTTSAPAALKGAATRVQRLSALGVKRVEVIVNLASNIDSGRRTFATVQTLARGAATLTLIGVVEAFPRGVTSLVRTADAALAERDDEARAAREAPVTSAESPILLRLWRALLHR